MPVIVKELVLTLKTGPASPTSPAPAPAPEKMTAAPQELKRLVREAVEGSLRAIRDKKER